MAVLQINDCSKYKNVMVTGWKVTFTVKRGSLGTLAIMESNLHCEQRVTRYTSNNGIWIISLNFVFYHISKIFYICMHGTTARWWLFMFSAQLHARSVPALCTHHAHTKHAPCTLPACSVHVPARSVHASCTLR